MSPPYTSPVDNYGGAVISSLFARQNGCVKCDGVAPVCPPTCPEGTSCRFTVMTCKDCPSAYCAAQQVAGDSSAQQPPATNTGAIAGGVIGGILAVTIITYLVWKFCIKAKRSSRDSDQYTYGAHSKEGFSDDSAADPRQSKRNSTHTVHSIASTVLTRASNIIQIAYIPGVTNRATPTSPAVLVPPVPPIPLAHSENGSVSSPYDEQHFFMPGDLRNSTYSGISTFSDRTSYARTSYAPRSSVASTIYGKHAVVSPLPAQKGNFLKPSIVSVKSRVPGSDGGDGVPAVPAVDFGKYDRPPPSPAFSIGSAFFKNASTSTATTVRPQMISVGSGAKTIEIKSKASSLTMSSSTCEPDSMEIPGTSGVTIVTTAPPQDQGPFADPQADSRSPSLAAVGEKRPSSRPESQQSKASTRDRSPFGDENVVRDN
ncbi:protein OPY2 [Microdochium nivale]|nr:protein OPY2 [Microdochium nivale]